MTYLRCMKYLASVIIISLFFSCATDVCNQRIAWPAQAGFHHVPDTLVLVSNLSVWGLNHDSLYKKQSLKQIEFPLSIANGSSAFVINVDSDFDTLTIFHTNTPYLISKQCGYGYQQVIDSVQYTKHLIKNLTWKIPESDKNDKENIQIFY
ncbi:MAG: DUF6452 family protein [Bacteroidetes bacterium]|nr:DUF6452 family protein [Bacteroidota bacterium]